MCMLADNIIFHNVSIFYIYYVYTCVYANFVNTFLSTYQMFAYFIECLSIVISIAKKEGR